MTHTQSQTYYNEANLCVCVSECMQQLFRFKGQSQNENHSEWQTTHIKAVICPLSCM